MPASARSARTRWLVRLTAVVMLVSLGVGAVPGAASTVSPGTQLWAKRFNGRASGSDYARAIGVSPDGSRMFVTGVTRGSGSDSRISPTLAYDALTGVRLWTSRYDSLQRDDLAAALVVSPDGSRVFVTGESGAWGDSDDSNYATIAYDASTGTQLWVARYAGPPPPTRSCQRPDLSPDGSRVFVTGTGSGAVGDTDYVTVAYDAVTGAELWATHYDGPDHVASSTTPAP